MKVEVQFVGSSIDMEAYEGKYLSWVFTDGHLSILEGESEDDTLHMVASYPEGRVVRVRVVAD